MRKILERCIHPSRDVLLPTISDTDPVRSFFIVACADDIGRPVIEGRIRKELQSFDLTAKLKPQVSSTMLHVLPGPSVEQLDDLAARIERLIHAHLLGKEKPR
jgi:hypothetical protein